MGAEYAELRDFKKKVIATLRKVQLAYPALKLETTADGLVIHPSTTVIPTKGLALGLMLGYLPMRTSQNNLQQQVNRIEQYLAAQQPSAPGRTRSACSGAQGESEIGAPESMGRPQGKLWI